MLAPLHCALILMGLCFERTVLGFPNGVPFVSHSLYTSSSVSCRELWCMTPLCVGGALLQGWVVVFHLSRVLGIVSL